MISTQIYKGVNDQDPIRSMVLYDRCILEVQHKATEEFISLKNSPEIPRDDEGFEFLTYHLHVRNRTGMVQGFLDSHGINAFIRGRILFEKDFGNLGKHEFCINKSDPEEPLNLEELGKLLLVVQCLWTKS